MTNVVTIIPGDTVVQDPADVKTYTMSWDDNLAVGVTIIDSSWTILPIRPSQTDAALAKTSEALVVGLRKTQLQLSEGTPGQLYEVANQVTTSETPPQTKERSFRVLMEDE